MRLRKAVPGADLLADIAAKGPARQLVAERIWYAVFKLYGEVADALIGVDLVGRKGLGGAGIQALGTGTAEVLDGRVGRKGDIRNDLCQEEVGAGIRTDEVCVLADPAEACAGGPGLLHDRGGIHKPVRTDIATKLIELLYELLGALAEHVVVVFATGVAGYFGCTGRLWGILRWVVAHQQADHGFGTGEELAGIDAGVEGVGHVGHLAVAAFG